MLLCGDILFFPLLYHWKKMQTSRKFLICTLLPKKTSALVIFQVISQLNNHMKVQAMRDLPYKWYLGENGVT